MKELYINVQMNQKQHVIFKRMLEDILKYPIRTLQKQNIFLVMVKHVRKLKHHLTIPIIIVLVPQLL